MRRRYGFWRSVPMLTLVLLLAGCGAEVAPLGPTPAAPIATEPVFAPVQPTPSGGPPEVVRVVYEPSLAFAPLFVALENGYFREQHLDVRVQVAQTNADAVAALAVATGGADVGAVGLSAAFFDAANSAGGPRIVATAASDPPTNAPAKLQARRSLTDAGVIRSPADLKGRKIAASGGGGGGDSYLALKVLQPFGLGAKDVTFVNLSPAEMLPALTVGSVDAALIATPYATLAVDMGVGRTLSDAPAPGATTAVYAYGGPFAARQDTARRFAIALLRAHRAVQGEGYRTDAHIRAYGKYLGGTEKLLRDTPPLVYSANLVLPRESVRDQERVCRESGWTRHREPPDIARWFAPEFAAYARAAS